MGNRTAKLLLDADQADIRTETFIRRREVARTAWGEKLIAAGHPDMEPTRFVGWSAERAAAELAHAASVAAAKEADAAIARRAVILMGLASACLKAMLHVRVSRSLLY